MTSPLYKAKGTNPPTPQRRTTNWPPLASRSPSQTQSPAHPTSAVDNRRPPVDDQEMTDVPDNTETHKAPLEPQGAPAAHHTTGSQNIAAGPLKRVSWEDTLRKPTIDSLPDNVRDRVIHTKKTPC